MKVTKESQNLIVLKDRAVWAYIVGIIFLLIGMVGTFKPDIFVNPPPLWGSLVTAFIGGFVIFFLETNTVRLDKTTNKLSLSQKNIVGQKSEEYGLDMIEEVQLSSTYKTLRKGKGGGHSYHLFFVLNNGKTVPLNPGRGVVIRGLRRQIIPEKNLGVKIANFLNVPFKEERPPTAGEVLKSISTAVQDVSEKEIKKRS